MKRNVKITKDRIGAATQLFTPEWIVRYMVENSLGRLWYEGHPDDNLKAKWLYYLDEAKQEEEVEAQLAEIRKEREKLQLQEIKLIEKNLPTLIQTNETEISTQIDAFFESKPKIDAFLKIDANAQRQEYKMAS